MDDLRRRTMRADKTILLTGVVDLGLPSGNLWASCNIGANGPEERGLYFSWANVDGHAINESYAFTVSAYSVTRGYSLKQDIYPDNLSYDAANVLLGSSYFIPSVSDFEELFNNTIQQWASINGVYGKFFYKIGTNGQKVDDAYIFMPAMGSWSNNSIVESNEAGVVGQYWSSDRGSVATKGTRIQIAQHTSNTKSYDEYPYCGLQIRPVLHPLGYDSKVEYLESSGQQRIDTGIIPDNSYGIYVDVTRLNTGDRYICGFRKDSGDTRFVIGTTGSKAYYGWGTYSQNLNNSITRGKIELNFMNSRFFKVTPNGGTTVSESIPSSLGFTPTMSILLFSYNNKGTPSANASYKVHAFKISNGTDIIMDLIPVRIGQVGCMYDRVSYKLFYNVGSGNFIVGPDK